MGKYYCHFCNREVAPDADVDWIDQCPNCGASEVDDDDRGHPWMEPIDG